MDYIGNYKIQRLIGAGGMASVYEGEHIETKSRVAIKVLNSSLFYDEDVRTRFIKEAWIMNSLQHPNITKFIGTYSQDGILAIAMELLNGRDLKQYIEEHGPLNHFVFIRTFSQVLDAFGYAHSKGVVHRDIKPSNIFLTTTGEVKILDFGVSKIIGQTSKYTKPDSKIGSPRYMSPEHVTSPLKVDARSDIYSLGCTMYYALTGTPPYFGTNNINEIYYKIIKESFNDLNRLDQWRWIVERACKKDMGDRFLNCHDFRDAFLSVSKSLVHTDSQLVQAEEIHDDTLLYEDHENIQEVNPSQWQYETDVIKKGKTGQKKTNKDSISESKASTTPKENGSRSTSSSKSPKASVRTSTETTNRNVVSENVTKTKRKEVSPQLSLDQKKQTALKSLKKEGKDVFKCRNCFFPVSAVGLKSWAAYTIIIIPIAIIILYIQSNDLNIWDVLRIPLILIISFLVVTLIVTEGPFKVQAYKSVLCPHCKHKLGIEMEKYDE